MKIFSIIKYVFTASGVAMLLGAVMAYNSSTAFLENAVSVEGTVIDLDSQRSQDSITFKPVVQFVTEDGQTVEFTSSAGTNPPSYSVGEKVEVLYAPEDPQGAKLSGFFELWGSVLILATMGGPMLFVGGVIFLIGKLKRRKKDYLQRDGVVVDAKFQSVRLNHSLTVNGENPFIVVCHWLNPATNCIHVFESENIWFDPSDYINTELLKVFMHKRNPKKYYVDISFIPQVAR
ncbi:DUF3592 domain-containing protein [Pseudomonas sp. G.S.17]|uniref:DUF3592 domain-containing protein n=1 Tax=Pseudomonas sp. G.S.17 TaxID=3137451 RepID=UPI00311CDAF9